MQQYQLNCQQSSSNGGMVSNGNFMNSRSQNDYSNLGYYFIISDRLYGLRHVFLKEYILKHLIIFKKKMYYWIQNRSNSYVY